MAPIYDTALGTMYGPHFLLLYFFIIILLIFFLRYISPYIIDRDRLSWENIIPEKPNPIELAYIRGGETEVINFCLFILIKRGLVIMLTNAKKNSIKVKLKPSAIAYDSLSDFEKIICKKVSVGEVDLKTVLESSTLKSEMKEACRKMKMKLETYQMIWDEEDIKRFRRIKTYCIGFIIILGGYKLLAALSHGHKNVIFLILFGLIGTFVLSKFSVDFFTSARGNDYLKKLKTIFSPVSGDKLLDQPFYLMEITLSIYGLFLIQRSRYYFLIDFVGKYSFSNKKIFWEGFDFFEKSEFWNSDNPFPRNNCGGSGSCSGSSSCSGGGSCGGGCGGGCGGCS